MIAALLLSSALSAVPADGVWTRDALIRDATERLLLGEDLPRDMDEKLLRLGPSDRIEVLIFLRRSGMMVGPSWAADRLLAPAKPQGTSQ